MRQRHELQKKLIELREVKGEQLELKRLKTAGWKEFTEKRSKELRKYRLKYIALVNQLMNIETTIANAAEESYARRKQSLHPLGRQTSWEFAYQSLT